jgi:sugar phosphate isomerase/epimerase
MKFGCSMEMVNMHTSEMGAFLKLSKSYWVEMFKLTSAAGFRGIELPYNPANSSGLTRSGMPISNYVTKSRYGSAKSLLKLLNDVGIDEVTGVHISANDVMNELISSGQEPDKLFGMFEEWAKEATEFISELGGKGLVVSPTPEIGLLEKFFGNEKKGWEISFLDKTAEAINRIGKLSAKRGVQTCIKNEYWSLIRGNAIDAFLRKLDQGVISYSPDLAHLKIAGVDPVKTVKKYSGKISYIRFSDTSFEDKENNYKKIWPEYPVTGAQRVYLNLGEGSVDIPGVYRELRKSGYDGWIICESKKTLNVYRALLYMRWYLDHVVTKS